MSAAPDIRRRDLAQIHIAKKQLAIDDDVYRDMLWTVARVKSSADLDFSGRQRVLDHLKSRGFVVKPAANGSSHGTRPKVSDANRALLGKIAALLAAAKLPWNYITHGDPSMVQRICGVERIEWASAQALGSLVAALTINQRRRDGVPEKQSPQVAR